ncbi:MAG: HAD family hydrolase [Arenicellales bacterium]|nr:HAD family hydrolase [Arenicellales bacterium]
MTLAIFDLDHTLLNGDSDYAWGEFLVEKGIVDRNSHSRRNAKYLADYNAGKLDFNEFITFQLEPLKNNPRQLIERMRATFVKEIIRPMITDKARDLVDWHRRQGHTLMIITSTNRFITRPIADEFGIELLIATEVEEVDGCFTGRTFDTPSFGEGKVSRLKAWVHKENESLTGSWFYSDSHNDLPLLRLVENPVALNPDPILKNEARLQNWRIVEW